MTDSSYREATMSLFVKSRQNGVCFFPPTSHDCENMHKLRPANIGRAHVYIM